MSAIAALGLILAVALALRLFEVGFGLPSMYDPDEPFFILKAYEMIDGRTLNPHWFGHPGTTTLYLVMIVEAGVALGGLLIGQWSSIDQFAAAVYADPGLIFIPARIAMVLIGVGCVWLTYALGRRTYGQATGLLAAGLLAINGLHIAWSQVVRTDLMASLFMLACLSFAARAAEDGRLRSFVLGGVMVGLAAASKWPAASIAVALIGAAIGLLRQGHEFRGTFRKLAVGGASSIATLFIVSPFLLLDWRKAVSDIFAEGKPAHLGHTGDGPWSNFLFYVDGQVIGTMGWLGLAAIIAGLWTTVRANRSARYTLLPAVVAYFALLAVQNLVWSRWILPLLPMLALLAAAGAMALVRAISNRVGGDARKWVLPAVAAVLLAPSGVGAWGAMRERTNDTRDQAQAWVVRHVPAGSRVVVEHLQIGLRDQPSTFLFPLGEAGCLDGRKLLSRQVDYEEVQSARKGSKIVDLGNVAPAHLDSCRADFAILSYYDLYLAERSRYPQQLATYAALLGNGRTVALFRPKRGEIGGPVIRIVAMQPTGRSN
ncbi:MAG TPA: glycosyltransferase family 39 protein [Sphingomicrobium sp.]